MDGITRTENLVTFAPGDIPVILTVAHGGNRKPEDVDRPREEVRGYKARAPETFKTKGDSNSREFVLQLARQLKARLGGSPYLVIAEFDRCYIDANRNDAALGPEGVVHENHAYDHPAAAVYYDAYHAKIKEYVADIRHRFLGRGLLFDIHGTFLQEKRIVVGMVTYDPADFQRYFRRGHVSVDQLLERKGFAALYHPLSGFLSALHDKALPGGIRTEVMPMERFQRASPSGGFTVAAYGSNRADGIDAFQLECSTRLYEELLPQTVEIYADALQTLYRNVMEAPYYVETVFAGKRCLGNENKSFSWDFGLQYLPAENYPAMVLVHVGRVRSSKCRVTLNGGFLGYLTPGSPVTTFNVSSKDTFRLKEKRNQLIVMDAIEPEEGHPFQLLKVDVVYCGA